MHVNANTLAMTALTDFSTTSTTSITCDAGTKVFTVPAGLPIINGQYMRAESDADPANAVAGSVTYAGTSLTMTVPAGGVFGTGTHTDWTIRHISTTLNVGGKGVKEVSTNVGRRAFTNAGAMAADEFWIFVYSELLGKFIAGECSGNIPRSIPIEMQVGFANRASCHLWITLPNFLNDDAIFDMLEYARINLNSGLNLHVTWGNEIWNTGFVSGIVAIAIAEKMGWTFSGNVGRESVVGYQLNRIADIAATTGWSARGGLEICGEFQCAGSPDQVEDFMLEGQRLGTQYLITAITNANPAVVTAAGHDFVDGQVIRIGGYQFSVDHRPVAGMTQITDGTAYTVAGANIGAGTFQLSGINSTAFGVYTSGGSCWRPPVAPNRPGDSKITLLSPAHYFNGKECRQFDSNYTASLATSDLLDWADDYDSGNAALMAAAIISLNDDINNEGDLSGPGSDETLFKFVNTYFDRWNDLAVTWDKDVVPYEAGHACFPPTTTRCTELSIDTDYTRKIGNLINAWRNSLYCYDTTTRYFTEFMTHSKSVAPGWLQLEGTATVGMPGFGNGWSLLDGGIGSNRYQSWFATRDFNTDAATSDSIGSQIIPHGRLINRREFRELKEAIAAQEAAERKAQEVTGKRRAVLARAAVAAEKAIASVEDDELEGLASLTRLLEAATAAKSLSDTVKLANEAHRAALAILEDEQEEEAVMLLAMHE